MFCYVIYWNNLVKEGTIMSSINTFILSRKSKLKGYTSMFQKQTPILLTNTSMIFFMWNDFHSCRHLLPISLDQLFHLAATQNKLPVCKQRELLSSLFCILKLILWNDEKYIAVNKTKSKPTTNQPPQNNKTLALYVC